MNYPFAGGWRFGNRPTSVEALYTPQQVSNDFLKKVAGLGGLLGEQAKPALAKALEDKPLTGLLETGGDFNQMAGGNNPFGGNMTTTEAGNPAREVSPAGVSASLNPSAKSAAAFATGGPLAALMASLQLQKIAPVVDLVVPGMNGFNRGDYGMSATEVGPPNAAQAKTIADLFARDFADYAVGDHGGFGGQVGFGGVDGAGSADYGGPAGAWGL